MNGVRRAAGLCETACQRESLDALAHAVSHVHLVAPLAALPQTSYV